jgi:hypothetical protein
MQRIKCRPRKLPVAKYCLEVDLEFDVGAPEMDDVAASATSSSAMTSAILWKLTMNLHLGRGSTFCKAAGCQLTFNFTEVSTGSFTPDRSLIQWQDNFPNFRLQLIPASSYKI